MNYQSSQSLIEGQKQNPIETKVLSRVTKNFGMTRKETIHGIKLGILEKDQDWDLDYTAKVIGCTSGQCLDVLKGNAPFTEEMQNNLYENTGIKISTQRLDKVARALWKARKIKYREIFDKYKYAIKPVKIAKTLFGKEKIWTKGFKHPLLGKLLKCYRAAFGDTQYSIPEKIALSYVNWEELTFCKRDFWHHVETGNSVDAKGNRAFYLATGLTVEQAITPFLEFIKANNINVNLEIETAEQLLDNLDINQNIIEQYLV